MSKFLGIAGYALTTAIAGGILAAWGEATVPGAALLCVIALLAGALVAAAIAVFFHRSPVIAGGTIMGTIGGLIVLLASLKMGPPEVSSALYVVIAFAITGVVSGFIYRLASLIGAPKKDQFIGG